MHREPYFTASCVEEIAEYFDHKAYDAHWLAAVAKSKKDKVGHIAEARTWRHAAELLRNIHVGEGHYPSAIPLHEYLKTHRPHRNAGEDAMDMAKREEAEHHSPTPDMRRGPIMRR